MTYKDLHSEDEGARTLNLRIDSPMLPESKGLQNKELKESDSENCKILAKNSGKQGENLPPELAGLVDRWPGLPENVKRAILALAGIDG